MDNMENIAWRPNQCQQQNPNGLSQFAYHQSPFSPDLSDVSFTKENLSTPHILEEVFSASSSVGDHPQPPNNSSQPGNIFGLNDKTSSVTLTGYTDFFPSAPNSNYSASSSGFSGNVPQIFNSYNDHTVVMQAAEMDAQDGISTHYIASKTLLNRLPSTRPSAGSGMNSGGFNKVRQSPLRPRVQDKVVKRRKATNGRLLLMKALDHLEPVRETLGSYHHLLDMVSQLEESIIQHMITDTRKARAEVGLHSSDMDSAYHSMSQASTAEDTESLATSFDFNFESYTSSSKASEEHYESSGQSNQMDITMDMETPRPTQTTIYHCIFQKPGETCEFSTPRKGDWVRHGESEEHFPQKRYMCLLCIKSLDDEDGNPLCAFCFAPISILSNNKQHFLRCHKAREGRHIFAGAREEHFKSHLKKQHGLAGIGAEQSTWTFDVQGECPSECGFCGDRFSLWHDRMNHIAAHFRKGVDIRSWRLPFGKNKAPRDYRPGIDHQKRYDDDDEDDGGDGHNPFGGGGRSRIPGVLFGSSGSSGSSQTSTSSYDSQDWASFAGGNMSELATGHYDSKLKVENYLEHQLVTDQPGEENVDSRMDECYSDSGMEPSRTPLVSPCTEEHAMILNDADEDEQGPTKKVVAEGIQDQVALEKISVGLQTSKRAPLCQASEWEWWEMLLWNMPLNFAFDECIWHCFAADEKRRSERLYKTCKTLAGILATNTPIGHALGFVIMDRLHLSGVILSKDLYAFVCLLHREVDFRGFSGGSAVCWMNTLSSLPSQRIKAPEEFWRVDFNFVPKPVMVGSSRSPSTISRLKSTLLNSHHLLKSMGTLGICLRPDRLLQHTAYQARTTSSFSSLDSRIWNMASEKVLSEPWRCDHEICSTAFASNSRMLCSDIDSSRSTVRPPVDILAGRRHHSRHYPSLACRFAAQQLIYIGILLSPDLSVAQVFLDDILPDIAYPRSDSPLLSRRYRCSPEHVPNANYQHVYCDSCDRKRHTRRTLHCPRGEFSLGHLPKEECCYTYCRQFHHWNCCSQCPLEKSGQDHLKDWPLFPHMESVMTRLGECSHDTFRIVEKVFWTRRQVVGLGRGVKAGSDAFDTNGDVTSEKTQCWHVTIDRKEGLFSVHLFYPCGACCVAEIVSGREEVEVLEIFLGHSGRGWSYGS